MSMRKQLTAMPSLASCTAASTVRRSSPILEMPYAINDECGNRAATEETLMITPPPTARMAGAARRMAIRGARRLTCMTRS